MVALRYLGINFWRVGSAVALFAPCLFAGVVSADSYNVNASVPYPAPTLAATVDGSPDGTTVDTALHTFTGTCQLQNPADAVSVWRGGSAIGSAPCNGTYSVQVMLQPGANLLTLRTANASQLYGPDGTPFTITLQLPPESLAPTPPSNPANPAASETPAQETTNTNAGASENLTATPTQPFSALSNNNDVSIQISVGGGQTPYTIFLDWGDGSTESHSVDQPGTYTFTHQYQTTGNYAVRGTVHDVLGASTEFSYAVVSGTPVATPTTTKNGAQTATTSNVFTDWVGHHWKSIAGTSGAVAVAGIGYFIGIHHTVTQTVARGAHAFRPRGKRLPKLRKRP